MIAWRVKTSLRPTAITAHTRGLGQRVRTSEGGVRAGRTDVGMRRSKRTLGTPSALCVLRPGKIPRATSRTAKEAGQV